VRVVEVVLTRDRRTYYILVKNTPDSLGRHYYLSRVTPFHLLYLSTCRRSTLERFGGNARASKLHR
jgi:hypothetical protein